jgi:hypothetical protein
LGLDAGAQFGVAQRVQSVFVEWTVGIDGATQNQRDLF